MLLSFRLLFRTAKNLENMRSFPPANVELAIKTKWLLSEPEAYSVLSFFDQHDMTLPKAGNVYVGKFAMDGIEHAVYVLKAGEGWTLRAISNDLDPMSRATQLSSLCDHVALGDDLPEEFTRCNDCGKAVRRTRTDD